MLDLSSLEKYVNLEQFYKIWRFLFLLGKIIAEIRPYRVKTLLLMFSIKFIKQLRRVFHANQSRNVEIRYIHDGDLLRNLIVSFLNIDWLLWTMDYFDWWLHWTWISLISFVFLGDLLIACDFCGYFHHKIHDILFIVFMQSGNLDLFKSILRNMTGLSIFGCFIWLCLIESDEQFCWFWWLRVEKFGDIPDNFALLGGEMRLLFSLDVIWWLNQKSLCWLLNGDFVYGLYLTSCSHYLFLLSLWLFDRAISILLNLTKLALLFAIWYLFEFECLIIYYFLKIHLPILIINEGSK